MVSIDALYLSFLYLACGFVAISVMVANNDKTEAEIDEPIWFFISIPLWPIIAALEFWMQALKIVNPAKLLEDYMDWLDPEVDRDAE